MTYNVSRRWLVVAGIMTIGVYSSFAQSARDEIAGDWYYRDSGGYLTYQFSTDGTFTAVQEMTARGYPRVTIRKQGNYSVSSSTVTVVTQVDVNGSPGEKVTETGRYDRSRDKLILRQANSGSSIEYSRSK